MTGCILSVDQNTKTGWACGRPKDAVPASGCVVLSKNRNPSEIMFNMMQFMRDKIIEFQPVLIVREALLPMKATPNQRQETGEITIGTYGIVGGAAYGHGIRLETAHPATVRKFFIGHGNKGNSKATKDAVVQRCHLLGLMPTTSTNDDRADAIAQWYWAASVYGHRMADKLFLFNEQKR